MTLREIYQQRGVEGLCDHLQPYVDQIEELTKPAPVPALPGAEEAEKEEEANG